jgi:hypothetical protein
MEDEFGIYCESSLVSSLSVELKVGKSKLERFWASTPEGNSPMATAPRDLASSLAVADLASVTISST